MLDANSPAALGRMRGLRAAHPLTTLRRYPSFAKIVLEVGTCSVSLHKHNHIGCNPLELPFTTTKLAYLERRIDYIYEDLVAAQPGRCLCWLSIKGAHPRLRACGACRRWQRSAGLLDAMAADSCKPDIVADPSFLRTFKPYQWSHSPSFTKFIGKAFESWRKQHVLAAV